MRVLLSSIMFIAVLTALKAQTSIECLRDYYLSGITSPANLNNTKFTGIKLTVSGATASTYLAYPVTATISGDFVKMRGNNSFTANVNYLLTTPTFASANALLIFTQGCVPLSGGGIGAGDNWGTQSVQHNSTLLGQGILGNELKVDTGLIATKNYVLLHTTGAAGGSLVGNYPNPTLGIGVVGTSNVADLAITSAKISNVGIALNKISTTGAVDGEALIFNGTLGYPEWLSLPATGISSSDTITRYKVVTRKFTDSTYATQTALSSETTNRINSDNTIISSVTLKADQTALEDTAASLRNNINYVSTTLTAADAAAAIYNTATYQTKVGFQTSNNVAYVAKKYSVAGDAAYQTQKAAQAVGNPLTPFVNPQEALRAISALTVARTISKGVIIVLEGNVYRVAEDLDTTGLGQFDYVYRNITTNTFFHPFPSTTSRTDDDSLCMSLAFPNIDLIFQKGSGVTHSAGRGSIMCIYDTIAPQRILGAGSFVLNVTNRRNNANANVNVTAGNSSLGEFEMSGDSLKTGRTTDTQGGWTQMSASSGSRMAYRFGYVSTYENNSLFRGSGGAGSVIEIDKFVTDTSVLPYMQSNTSNPQSPTPTFLNNGGYGCNVYIKYAYIASNPIIGIGFVGTSGQINFRCDKIEQKFRTTYKSDYIGSATSTSPQGVLVAGTPSCAISFNTSSSYTNSDFSANITVGSFVGENAALAFFGSGNIKKANIKFTFGSIRQDSNSVYPKTSIFFNHTGTIDSSLIVVDANVLNSSAEAVKIVTNTKVLLNGVYKTNSQARSAVYTTGTNTQFGGTAMVAASQASIDGLSGSSVTCFPTSTANTSVSSNVTVTGTLNVNSAYKQ